MELHETLLAGELKTAQFCSMCGRHFCSMRTTKDLRKYASDKDLYQEVFKVGMEEKARKFSETGVKMYSKT